ncbi:hypothetical protein [Hymenobacter norwichensis]|uniref:hypothetical protein n=1 Tax=Hymenobacter norwichensis TaxID=223903 RepID=UPI0012F89F81|nr:hypothetical protein [Hymenobacter norwichensis]
MTQTGSPRRQPPRPRERVRYKGMLYGLSLFHEVENLFVAFFHHVTSGRQGKH